MNRLRFAQRVALAVLVVLGLAGLALAQQQVPFKGGLEGTDFGIPIPNTPFASVTAQATRNATHLGKFSLTIPNAVNTANRTATGTFQFIAAKGDTVFGTMSGKAVFSQPNVLAITETAIITGGTGRFAGSRGGFPVARLKNTVTGATTAAFTGTISAPGKGNSLDDSRCGLAARQNPARHRPGARSARRQGRRHCNAGHSQSGNPTMRVLSLLDDLQLDSSRRRSKRGRRRRLSLDALEDRCLLNFSPAVNYPIPLSPLGMVVGDFNGDERAFPNISWASLASPAA
jgi:hypothetical protein